MNPLVSIIIVAFNDEKWLPRCLKSIAAQTLKDIEVLIIDDRNFGLGFGGCCNQGAAQAKGDYFYFINADVWLEPDCIERLFRSAAYAVCARELEYDGNNLVSGERFQGSPGMDVFGCSLSNNGRLWNLFCAGSFLFIHRGIFESIGRFDPKFFLFGEEQDISWRLAIFGAKVGLVRLAKIHHAARTHSAWEFDEARRGMANRNHLLTILKNAQHVLLFLAVTYAALMAVEAVYLKFKFPRRSIFRRTLFDPLLEVWALRGHIQSERRRVKFFRQRSDWYFLLNFFNPFRFAHWKFIGGTARAASRNSARTESGLSATGATIENTGGSRC